MLAIIMLCAEKKDTTHTETCNTDVCLVHVPIYSMIRMSRFGKECKSDLNAAPSPASSALWNADLMVALGTCGPVINTIVSDLIWVWVTDLHAV